MKFDKTGKSPSTPDLIWARDEQCIPKKMKKLSKISDFLVQTFGFFLSARKISHKDNTVQVVAKKKKKNRTAKCFWN